MVADAWFFFDLGEFAASVGLFVYGGVVGVHEGEGADGSLVFYARFFFEVFVFCVGGFVEFCGVVVEVVEEFCGVFWGFSGDGLADFFFEADEGGVVCCLY